MSISFGVALSIPPKSVEKWKIDFFFRILQQYKESNNSKGLASRICFENYQFARHEEREICRWTNTVDVILASTRY